MNSRLRRWPVKAAFIIISPFFLTACLSDAQLDVSSLGLAPAAPQLLQKGSEATELAVNSASNQTEIQVQCVSGASQLEISYDDAKNWWSLGNLQCVGGIASVSYTVPTSVTVAGAVKQFPVMEVLLRLNGDLGPSKWVATKFVQGAPNLGNQTVTVQATGGYVNTPEVVLDVNSTFSATGTSDYKPKQIYITSDPTCLSGAQWEPFSIHPHYVLPSPNALNSIVDVPGLTNVKAITANHFYTCAINSAGELFCWGLLESDSTALAPIFNQSTPVKMMGLPAVREASLGWYHLCAVTNAGAVKCWGDGAAARFGGTGDGPVSTTPVDITGVVVAP